MFGRSTKGSKASSSNGNNQRRGLIPSVVASGMHVLGNIVSDGTLDIDGHIDGNVRARQISIRPNGHIRGDVTADVVDIYGTVEGVIKAQAVNLYASAHVVGTIMHEALTIEDGAFVDGKFKRTDRIFADDESAEMKRLAAPADTGFNDNDEPVSEVEIKILENLRLIR
jgi:cytoskeletal protein CcmA (bactofilin family)